ncbi:MAG: arginine--tRNA ligase, partial [Planctomycetales bacterium]
QPPRDVAAQIISALEVDDLCQPPEIAGPGFVNMKLREDWLTNRLNETAGDERLGIGSIESPRSYVIDYSSPNVAKPMHVGHIRSTVIGDALARTLRFLGHKVVSDNHIGDWGTQFGMIIYGYKHFLDQTAYEQEPVIELARIYRLVNQLVQYKKDLAGVVVSEDKLASINNQLREGRDLAPSDDKKADKKAAKDLRRLEKQAEEASKELKEIKLRIQIIQNDSHLADLVSQHADIDEAVLRETVLLHEGDEENLALWEQFLPACMEDIDRIYRRLDITFDKTMGESHYHDQLAGVVSDLQEKGIATESDDAICVFLNDQDPPMIIQKKDGAFLYATTDLATIQYRRETWHPDAILYVVDHRQGLHFQHLFETVRRAGCDDVELDHIQFGTVLGDDGRPFKTRSGSTVGLDGLLDEAVKRALQVVSNNDEAKPDGPQLSGDERKSISETVGIAALKYADLSQNRESDYVFSYDKMLALNGNTATYMQYAYARVQSILRKGGADVEKLWEAGTRLTPEQPAERALALAVLRFPEALELVVEDYRPNHLTNYLFDEVAKSFSTFFEQCPVLKAETEELRNQRFLLCDLTGRVIKLGLSMLGIDVVEQM